MELQQDFNTDVLEASHKNAVLVDFWAPWCGPCQVLGPILEETQSKRKDFKLVKVNVDQNQELAQEYGVRGIPQLNLFVNGASIQEVSGALSAPQLEKWLDEHLPSKEKERWIKLLDQLPELTPPERSELLEQFLADYAGHKPAALELAKSYVLEDPDKATELISSIKIEDPEYTEVQYLRKLIEAQQSGDPILKAFVQSQKEKDTIIALKELNDQLLHSPPEEKEHMSAVIVAIYKWLSSHDENIKKQRKIFEMYSS